MSMSEETISDELNQGEADSLVFQILNGVAPFIYTFSLLPAENSTDGELSSKIGMELHRGNYSYSLIKNFGSNLVKTFIIFNISENQLKVMAGKYKIKDYLFFRRENGVFTLSQNILSLLASDTAKGGERFTLTKDELLSLSEEQQHRIEGLNKQSCESIADIDLTESSNWQTRGQVKLFYDRLLKDLG